MKLAELAMSFFGSKKAPVEAPEGMCPNCWGRQEYADKFYEAVEKAPIDLNNVDARMGWIQAYAAKNLEGIKIQERDGSFECVSCKVSYKAE